MRTLALVLRQGYEYSRRLREGVVLQMEGSQGWQLLQLPMHDSGEPPVASGLDSLSGVVTWTEQSHPWIEDLIAKGIPIINCGGGLNRKPGVTTVRADVASIFQLAVQHFADLSLRKAYFFGRQVSSDRGRSKVTRMMAELGKPMGVEVDSLETRGKNPDENLDILLTPENEHELIETFGRLDGPVGIFAEDDYYARLACNVALLAGQRIPGDVAVLGVGGDLVGWFGEPTISTIPLPGKQVGRKAFELIEGYHQGEPLPDEDRVESAASALVVRESTGGKSKDVAMERVFRSIEREACRGMTVQELAPLAGMSLRAMRRRYLEVHGMEPSTHIRKVRIAGARKQLSETDAPVAEVAAACGFQSQTAFYNYFQRHTGVSPTAFRAEARATTG